MKDAVSDVDPAPFLFVEYARLRIFEAEFSVKKTDTAHSFRSLPIPSPTIYAILPHVWQ